MVPDTASPTDTVYNLTCHIGHSGDSNGSLVCSPTGTWLNRASGCVPNTCSTAELTVSHGRMVPGTDSPTMTQYNLACDPGYIGDSNGTLLCGSTGMWLNKAECLGKGMLCNSIFCSMYSFSRKHIVIL